MSGNPSCAISNASLAFRVIAISSGDGVVLPAAESPTTPRMNGFFFARSMRWGLRSKTTFAAAVSSLAVYAPIFWPELRIRSLTMFLARRMASVASAPDALARFAPGMIPWVS